MRLFHAPFYSFDCLGLAETEGEMELCVFDVDPFAGGVVPCLVHLLDHGIKLLPESFLLLGVSKDIQKASWKIPCGSNG